MYSFNFILRVRFPFSQQSGNNSLSNLHRLSVLRLLFQMCRPSSGGFDERTASFLRLTYLSSTNQFSWCFYLLDSTKKASWLLPASFRFVRLLHSSAFPEVSCCGLILLLW